MIGFIAGMCLALPLTLLPQQLLYKCGLLTRVQKEKSCVRTGQWCARGMLKLFPFCILDVKTDFDMPSRDDYLADKASNANAAVWVCNHTSMLDVFLLLAADRRMRGKYGRRPIKVVYWKDLEANPVSKLFFRQAGFIPVQMAANAAGENNAYDRSSFKSLLKAAKQAFAEGFDLGLLPEGQLNPTPESGLQPVFTGAYTLAKMSRRPVYMMGMYGAHTMWHPSDDKGMHAVGRHIKIRCYGHGRMYDSAEDFVDAFENVVGHWGQHGTDLPQAELDAYLVEGKQKKKKVEVVEEKKKDEAVVETTTEEDGSSSSKI